MIRRLLRDLAIALCGVLLGLGLLEQLDPPQTPMLVQTDFRRCIRDIPGPLRPRPRINGDNRQQEIA